MSERKMPDLLTFLQKAAEYAKELEEREQALRSLADKWSREGSHGREKEKDE